MNSILECSTKNIFNDAPAKISAELTNDFASIEQLISDEDGVEQVVSKLVLALMATTKKLNKTRKFVQSLGTVVPSDKHLVFHRTIGEARDEGNDITLTMSTGQVDGLPFVECEESNATFVMNWDGITRLAVRCGLLEKKQ